MIFRFCGLVFFLSLLFLPEASLNGQGIAVNSTGSVADTSAMLDISASQKGLLIPRLSTTERNSIFQPARALLIFNISTGSFEVNTGTPQLPVWESIVTIESLLGQNNFWKQGGNNISSETGIAGTLNARSFGLLTNNTIRLFIDSTSGKIGINTQAPKATLHISGTDALIVPVGNTSQRPAVPVPGMIRFNTETGKLEGYTADGWKSLQ